MNMKEPHMMRPSVKRSPILSPSVLFFVLLSSCLVFLTLPGRPALSLPGDGHDQEGTKDRFYRFERQEVEVKDFEARGYILDIGGGGEGVIGRLKGEQVIAIDISKRELADAPAGPLKVIMDARDLQFLDAAFNTATSFFTLMYVDGSDHPAVFKEIHRVLVPGGRFLIWDVLYPERTDPDIDIAVVPLEVKLPGEKLGTGYGSGWPEKGRDLTYYIELARTIGFEIVSHNEDDLVFYLELKKP
jgi:SAM-dependent methyltransferase